MGSGTGRDYLVRRTVRAVTTIFVIVTANFFLFRVLPGSVVTDIAHVPGASPKLVRALTVQFGLDKPKWEQYFIYLDQLVRGNLGVSWSTRLPVSHLLRTDLLNTIPMVALGTFVAIVLGVGLGVLSAWRHDSWIDHVCTSGALVFWSLPTQWVGLILLVGLSNYFPSNGMNSPYLIDPTFLQHLGDVLDHMVLPALTLALTSFAQYALVVRTSLRDTFGEDYILTARAKGLPSRTVVTGHALRNAMLPIVTLLALSLGRLVAGAILIESVFSWPGIGQATYDSVTQRDYPMLQGIFLVITTSVVFFNYLADLSYLRLDPRVAR